MPKYYLILQKDDRTTKKVPWDKEEDPTDEQIDALLKLPDENPNTIRHGLYENLVQPIIDTGKKASDEFRAGNYPAAFGTIAQPITRPFTGAAEYLNDYLGGKSLKDTGIKAGKELAGYTGLNVDAATDAYSHGQYRRLAGLVAPTALGMAASGIKSIPKLAGDVSSFASKSKVKGLPPTNLEHGPYPLRDNPNPIGPEVAKEITPFEGLTSSPEHQAFNWDEEHQQGLPLEWNAAEHQLDLHPELRSEFTKFGGSPEKSAFEALVPDRYKGSPELEYPKITGPKQPELFSNPSPEVPIVMQPKMFDYERPTWSRYAEQQGLPLEYDTLSQAEVSEVPEIQKAVQQVVQQTKNDGSKLAGVSFSRKEGYVNPDKVTNFKKFLDDNFKADYSRLVQDSPAGRGIASMIDKYRTEVDRTSGEISAKIKDVVKPLDKSQYEQFQHYLDTGDDIPKQPTITVDNVNIGKKPKVSPTAPGNGITNSEMISNLKDIPLGERESNSLPPEFAHMTQPTEANYSVDPMVQLALDTVRDIDTKFTQRATDSGIHLKTSTGEVVPFLGKDNYWPRIYDSSMFADKPALIERLVKNGMSPDAAANAVNNSRRFGERLIDPQNQRVMNLPEYRKDLGALLKHYDDMAYRIVGSETFGVKDIADPESAISQLVKQTKDVGSTTKILRQYLDREGGIAPYEADITKKITKAATLFYLSKFAITNSNQLGMIPLVTDMASTGKALKTFLKNPKKTWRTAESYGALQTVLQEGMRNIGGEGLASKMYGIKASEGFNRTISAIAGEHYVKDLFNKLQKNPDNTRIRKSLEDLTLTNANDLVSQDSLSEKQIAYAATRVAEKAQGRAQSIDLPYNWDRSPYVGLLVLYKKFAFVQGKLIKNALKNDPTQPFFGGNAGVNINPKNAALMAVLFQVAGELTGDSKAAIKGIFTGNPDQQIENRGANLGIKNKFAGRVIQNYIDSMFLGLLGDAAQSVRGGKQSMYNFAAGPIAGGVIDTVGNVASDIGNAKAVIRNPNKSNTLRGLAIKVPYVGGGIYQKMKENSK